MISVKEEEDMFVVTETTMSFTQEYVKVLRYSKDLLYKKANDDPWRKTTIRDAQWFNKHYRPRIWKGSK